jgi:aryl-alcohol dehydrogenase-like predicted oxidoreductase
MTLDHYKLLGRSGLRFSPLSLGTMTFGSEWAWGADGDEARRIFDLFVDRGGNFVDTSVNYTDGGAERLLGTFIGDKRERIVLVTKFTMAREPGNPNSGGNHRLNMVRSVQHSLTQVGTDRTKLLYLHAWDMTTRPDEVMRALDDLVRSGKVRYLGICNTPAWRIAQMQTLADIRGWSPFIALQIEYRLVERTVEHELLPAAEALGLGVLPWSPRGGGVLTGKYSLADIADSQEAGVSASRKSVIASSGHMNQRAIEIAEEVSGRRRRRQLRAIPGGACLDNDQFGRRLSHHRRSHARPGRRQSGSAGSGTFTGTTGSTEPDQSTKSHLFRSFHATAPRPATDLRRCSGRAPRLTV